MRYGFCLILALLAWSSSAVEGQRKLTVLEPGNKMTEEVAAKVSPTGTLYFKPGLAQAPEVFLEKNKRNLGLTADDEMRLFRRQSTESGEKVYRFQQYHRGVPVEGAEYLMQARDGMLLKLKGRVAEKLWVTDVEQISEAAALKRALLEIPATRYAWDPPRENESERDVKPVPVGERVFVRVPDRAEDSYVLAYAFDIEALEPFQALRVYIDTETGRVLKTISLIEGSSAAVGTAYTQYNGARSFATRHRGWPNYDYVLQDHTRGEITTKRFANVWGLAAQVTDGDNHWWHNEASAHWAVQKAHDYFKDVHYRNGIDNQNEQVRVYAKSSFTGHLHASNCTYLYFRTAATTLDIAGHEFTHGIINHTSNLAFEGESGALNESFGDIFGAMTERQFRGGYNYDWLSGSEKGTGEWRDMEFPHNSMPVTDPQPEIYQETGFWFPVVGCAPSILNDECGVHTNSGVQNRWFSLLVDGGLHNGQTVVGIGEVAASRIAYRNMTVELISTSDHHDAREGAIDAAEYIYGFCSNAVEQVTNAWAAVGVGAPFGACAPPLSGSISGPFQGDVFTLYNWQAIISGGTPPYYYSWEVNFVSAGSGSSIYQSFSQEGTYQIDLTVTDSSSQGIFRTTSVVIGSCGESPVGCAEE